MRYIKEADGRIYVECEICGQIMKLRKELVKDNGSLQEEVECFCGTRDRIINGLPQKNNMINVVNVPTRIVNNHVPKCPTCGSERVSKITLTSKMVGGAMWGLFSSNVRKSYKCDNCGYKW